MSTAQDVKIVHGWLSRGLLRVLSVSIEGGPFTKDAAHAPVVTNVPLQGIDTILEQANSFGRKGPVVHGTAARFGREVLVLVEDDPEWDWFVPAVRQRIEAVIEIDSQLDPEKTQWVHLGRGEKLRVLGHELWCVKGREGILQVKTKCLENPTPQPPPSNDPGPGWAGRMLRGLRISAGWRRKTPARREAPATNGLGTRIGGFLSSSVNWRASAAFALTGLSRTLRALLNKCRRNWELTGAVVCGAVALVLLAGMLPEGRSERAIAGDVPGFFTGTFRCEFHAKPVEYGLYVPKRGGEGMPLIVFLPNSGNVLQVMHQALSSGIRQRLKNGEDFEFGVLFAVTQGPAWRNRVSGVMEVVEHVVEDHRFDRKRMYLMGDGQGGCALWDLARDDRWAALVAIEPACTAELQRARVPLWILERQHHGKKQAAGDGIRDFAHGLMNQGREVVYSEYGKESEVYRDPKLFAWLARKSRP